MARQAWLLVLTLWLLTVGAAGAADLPVGTASGTVKKVTANVLLLIPRGPDGRFRETLVLKLSGTTRISTVTAQRLGGKLVLVQQDTDPRTLQPNQTIAVIYALTKDDLYLLSAVAQPAAR